jgi:hypothetical protein
MDPTASTRPNLFHYFCSLPLLTVPFAAIESLWEAFNDVADGFGITLYEFQEICAELTNELGVNRVKMDDKSDALFRVLDSDAVSVEGFLFVRMLL